MSIIWIIKSLVHLEVRSNLLTVVMQEIIEMLLVSNHPSFVPLLDTGCHLLFPWNLLFNKLHGIGYSSLHVPLAKALVKVTSSSKVHCFPLAAQSIETTDHERETQLNLKQFSVENRIFRPFLRVDICVTCILIFGAVLARRWKSIWTQTLGLFSFLSVCRPSIAGFPHSERDLFGNFWSIRIEMMHEWIVIGRGSCSTSVGSERSISFARNKFCDR